MELNEALLAALPHGCRHSFCGSQSPCRNSFLKGASQGLFSEAYLMTSCSSGPRVPRVRLSQIEHCSQTQSPASTFIKARVSFKHRSDGGGLVSDQSRERMTSIQQSRSLWLSLPSSRPLNFEPSLDLQTFWHGLSCSLMNSRP